MEKTCRPAFVSLSFCRNEASDNVDCVSVTVTDCCYGVCLCRYVVSVSRSETERFSWSLIFLCSNSSLERPPEYIRRYKTFCRCWPLDGAGHNDNIFMTQYS